MGTPKERWCGPPRKGLPVASSIRRWLKTLAPHRKFMLDRLTLSDDCTPEVVGARSPNRVIRSVQRGCVGSGPSDAAVVADHSHHLRIGVWNSEQHFIITIIVARIADAWYFDRVVVESVDVLGS